MLSRSRVCAFLFCHWLHPRPQRRSRSTRGQSLPALPGSQQAFLSRGAGGTLLGPACAFSPDGKGRRSGCVWNAHGPAEDCSLFLISGGGREKCKIWVMHISAKTVLLVEEERNILPVWVCRCAGIAMLSAAVPTQWQCQGNPSNSSASSFRLPSAVSRTRPPPPQLQETWPCPGWKARPSRTACEMLQALGDKHVLQRGYCKCGGLPIFQVSPWWFLIP